ncbi:hypothetical protein D3C71_1794170 [compost metagenome]
MQNFPFNHPGKGLQTDMRMWANVHPLRGTAEYRRACMVEKAPRAQRTPFTGGQGTAYRDTTNFGVTYGNTLDLTDAVNHRTITGRG